MFNWFDKLLVKIAKKILNKYAPTGEFIAYINEQEEKVLKKLGGYGQPVNETGVKSFKYTLSDAWRDAKTFFSDNKEMIVDVGMGIGKAWIDMNDQERKTAVNEKAYNDYMKQVEAAGQEAESAVALNLTPMEITNVPQTKADVTDFTLVAARGGLMNLPTRQRKRYAFGPNEIDVEAMQEESIGPYELQMEEGVNISPMVQEDKQKQLLKAFAEYQAAGGTLSLQEFAVMWIEENAARTVEGDTQMASAPSGQDEAHQMYLNAIQSGEFDGTFDEFLDELERMRNKFGRANGGIIGLRHGGRPGYQFGIGPQQGIMPQQGLMSPGLMPQQGLRPGYELGVGPVTRGMGPEEIETETEYITTRDNDTFEVDTINRIYEEQGNEGLQAYLERNPDLKDKYVIVADGMSGELTIMPNKLHPDNMDMEKITLDFENLAGGNAKGGLPKRVRKAPGGIMDLGGLEKDYRTTGGFVPIGAYERKDDVPARLSKNEFVMTADAVRAAGGGSINKGAQRMYDTMKHLEAQPQSKRMMV
jgi:hypothetical protein